MANFKKIIKSIEGIDEGKTMELVLVVENESEQAIANSRGRLISLKLKDGDSESFGNLYKEFKSEDKCIHIYYIIR